MSRESVLAEHLHDLGEMDLEGLRRFWSARYGPPPRLRSPDVLRRMLAWKLQVAVHGGLDRAARDALRKAAPSGSRSRLPTGSIISREWRGVRHEVRVTADGYEHEGKTYRSLSAIATRIAATKWNGWRFFGLPAPSGRV